MLAFLGYGLALTDYRTDIAPESELKVKQLAVAMGDDHYPNLEKVWWHRG